MVSNEDHFRRGEIEADAEECCCQLIAPVSKREKSEEICATLKRSGRQSPTKGLQVAHTRRVIKLIDGSSKETSFFRISISKSGGEN